jgi:hypothetical protein
MTKLDSQCDAMLNGKTTNDFEDSQKTIEEISLTAISGGEAGSGGGGGRARSRAIPSGMSGERSKNSPEKRKSVRPHEQVAASNSVCAWLRSSSEQIAFAAVSLSKFVFVGIAKFDDYGSASSLTIAEEKIGEAALSVAYATSSFATT